MEHTFLAVFNVSRHGEGQGLVEYGLILTLVSIAAIASLVGLRGGIDGLLRAIIAAFGL